ncbi:MAG: DUF3299 domain-containing protein [Nibricoccus sp.]
MFSNLVKSASRLLRIQATGRREFLSLALILSIGAANRGLAEPSVLTFAQMVACPVKEVGIREKDPSANVLPEAIRSAVGREVRVTGYMLPLVMENGRARQLLLMRNTMACCYGQPPAANEYLVIKTPPPGLPVTQDVPVALQGVFRIEPVFLGGAPVEYFHLDNAILATR